ncbi:MAG: amidohydrolase [Alphaproteobacteria bacterium]|nr:amidohydrolase [Alphaproteobacteria bacterium]
MCDHATRLGRGSRPGAPGRLPPGRRRQLSFAKRTAAIQRPPPTRIEACDMSGVKGTIDIVVNLSTPKEKRLGQLPSDDHFRSKLRQPEDIRRGVTIPDYLKRMNASGVERSLLIAARCGDMRVRGSTNIPYESVHGWCKKYPDRFSGLAGVDPTRGMDQLRDLERAVKEYGFVGAHFYPHWFDMAPDHAYVFPIYAKCIELDIPIMMQVGHNLIYQRDRRLPSVGRPICLDRISILYPELRLIGIHLGVPWTDEMISMAWKHEHIYIGGDAYAPKHWPKQMIHYANTYGSHKFMFGTDWPVIDPIRAVREVEDHHYRPDSKKKIMRENALRVFKLPRGGLKSTPKGWLSALQPQTGA